MFTPLETTRGVNSGSDTKIGFPKPKLITELCHQHIEEVFIGGHFVLATTRDHRLFVWGDNNHGLISDVNDRYLTPIVIEVFNGKAIKDVVCGDNHAMVVLEDNRVFVCGKNRETPITCAEEVYCLEGLSIKRLVSRVYDETVLLSTDGKVYRLTTDGEIYKELKATLHLNVIDICAANDKEFYFLTDDGKIYLTRGKGLEVIELKEKFTSLCKYGNNWPTLAVNKEFVFEVIDKIVSKTKYKTFEEYFLYKWQITHKMMRIPGREVMKKKLIGSGGFGQVFRAETRGEVFALKEVKVEDMHKDINDKNSELEIMKKTNSNFVAWLFHSWMSIDKTLLYLQMELCDCHLDQMFNDKIDAKILSPLQDFVFCMEVFKELMKCVHYLHSRQPKIIHRDLKPSNVLIKYHDNNGHLVKLCDFGLSKIILRESQTNISWVGTTKYRAPEVNAGMPHNENVDIFSLGLMLRDVFRYLDQKDSTNEIIPVINNIEEDKVEDSDSNKIIPKEDIIFKTSEEISLFVRPWPGDTIDMPCLSSKKGCPRKRQKTDEEGDSFNVVGLTASSSNGQIPSSSNGNGSLRKRPKTDEENHVSGDQLIDTSSSDSSDEGIDIQSTRQETHDSNQYIRKLLKKKLDQLEKLSSSMIKTDPNERPSCDSIIEQFGDISRVETRILNLDNLPDQEGEFKFLKFLNKYK